MTSKDKRKKLNPSLVDWNLQDVVIARQVGISRERVRQVRNNLGIPRSPKHHAITYDYNKDKKAARWKIIKKAVKEGGEKVLLKDVSKKTGFCPSAVAGYLRSNNYELPSMRLFRKYSPASWNWDYPSILLRKIHGVCNTAYVSTLRSEYGHPPKFLGTTRDGRARIKKILKKKGIV